MRRCLSLTRKREVHRRAQLRREDLSHTRGMEHDVVEWDARFQPAPDDDGPHHSAAVHHRHADIKVGHERFPRHTRRCSTGKSGSDFLRTRHPGGSFPGGEGPVSIIDFNADLFFRASVRHQTEEDLPPHTALSEVVEHRPCSCEINGRFPQAVLFLRETVGRDPQGLRAFLIAYSLPPGIAGRQDEIFNDP